MSVDNNKVYTNNDIMDMLMRNQEKLNTITDDISHIKNDISSMKRNHDALSNKVTSIESDVSVLQRDANRLRDVEANMNLTMNAYCRSQISAVKSMYNSMQYNVIVRNLQETIIGDDRYETHENSVERAYYVLENVFGMADARNIVLATAHRLPSTKAGPKPLIFKLAKLADKQKLWDNIRNVKAYNTTVAVGGKVSVQMIQLPQKLAHDKNSLQNDFDEAYNKGLKPKWRYLRKSGQYCYTIGNTYYKPNTNYFLHNYENKKIGDE